MNNFLKYGDLILFYGEGIKENQQDLSPHNKETGGALSAIGLTDTGVYYQNFPKNEGDKSFTLESKLNFSNLSDCVYRITPKLNFDFHKDFKKTLKYFKNLQRTIRGAKKKDKEQFENLRDSLAAKLKKLKDRIKKEQLLNENIVNDSLDQVITYGIEVQLMHYNSNSFLKARNDCSQTENIGYNCELSNWYSGGMVFKILPKFKSRQDGDVIQLRDHIILKNMKHDAFISIAKELPMFKGLDYGDHVNPYLPKVSVFDERCNRYRIYLSQESNSVSAFQIILYRKNTSVHGDELLGGDIVKITHTEVQADLTANICFGDEGYEVFMRNYHGEFDDENSSLASYWVMEHENFENAGENFKIRVTEDKIRSKSTVRLRHFVSGCLIKSKTIKNTLDGKVAIRAEEEEINSCYLQTDKDSPNYIQIDMEPVVKSSNLLINKNTYFLTSSKDMKFLKYNRKDEVVDFILRDNKKLMDILEKRDPKYQFYPLEDEDLSEKKFRSIFSEEFSSEDAYTIERMPYNSKFGCLIVRSMLPILYGVTSVYKNQKSDTISSENYLQIQETLKKLIGFLFEIESSDEIDYFEIEENPLEERQKILKDFGILDILVELLYYPFRNKIYSLKNLKMDSYFAKTLELTYTSIRYTIAEYRPNELYSSQWIGLIMKQSMHTSGKNDIKAGQTLTELIDNNEKILESRIEKKTIQNFIKFLCEEDKDEKFLNILRAICICNDEPMMQNQKEISELMLQDEEVMKELLFSLDKEPEDLFVNFQIKGYEHLPLDELQQRSLKDDNKEKVYRYFLAMVKLLSDLCKDRNYLAIDILQKKFPFEYCFDIMRGSFSCSIKEVFTSLLKNLWIDVSPFQNIEFPILIKIWDEIEDLDVFKDVEKKDHDQYQELKKFIIAHLKEMKTLPGEYGNEKSRLDFSILNLTEKMFKLGFLTDIEEINTVIQYLMKYLGTDIQERDKFMAQTFTKSLSIYTPSLKEKPKEITHTEIEEEFVEDDLKLIECKKKICNILSFIFKIQDQLRIINFLIDFKSLVKEIEKNNPGLLGSFISPEIYLQQNSKNAKVNQKLKEKEEMKTTIIQRMDNLVEKIAITQTKVNLKNIHKFKSKLFELVMYKDLSLKTCALDLLGKIHQKNKILGETIFRIQIIDDPSSKVNYQKAKSAAFTLSNIGDTIENWYQDSNSREMRSLVVILNSIYKGLINQLKTEDNLLDMKAIEEVQKENQMGMENFQFKRRRPRATGTYLEIKSELTDIHQYMLDSSDEKIDVFEQELFRNSGIYIGLIKMLEFDAETENTDRSDSQKMIIRKMYRILAKSVKSSDTNKKMLTRYLEDIILDHYQDDTADLNAYFLLKQIIINNKLIILDVGKVRNIVDAVCEKVEQFKDTNIAKSYSLSILTDLMKYKDYVLKKNQNIILAKVISKEFDNLMIDFDDKDFEVDLTSLGKTKNLTSYVRTIQGNKVLILPEKICYIISYLNLLTVCTEDKNAFSENICQNLLNLDALNKFIACSDLIIVLKYSILNYFYHVFLDTERDIPFHIMEIFLNILKLFCEDFEFYARKKYIEIEDSIESYDDLSILSFDSFKSFNQWIVDYLIILIKSFTNIIKRNLNLIPDSKPAQFYEDFLMDLINFSHITYIKYENYDEIKEHLDAMLTEIHNNHQSGKISEQLKQKHRLVLKDNAKDDEEFDPQDKKLLGSQKKPRKRRGSRLKSSRPSTMTLFPKIEYLIDLYFNSDLYKKRCYEDFSEIITILNKIHLTSSSVADLNLGVFAHYSHIDFRKFCTSLMKYLSPSNEEADNRIRILGLRIFRNYIERNSRDLEQESLQDFYPLVDWEVENWNDIIPILTSRQDRLLKFNIIELICKLFTSIEDLNVIKEILLLSIALLFGGNKTAQTTFYNFFINDTYSHFLNKLKDVMLGAFEIVRRNMKQKNYKVMKNYYKRYGVNKSKFTLKQNEEIEKKQRIKAEVEKVDSNYQICRYIFKFLQLLCEGHNEDLQNLLREQREKSEFSLYKSINFISTTATLWGNYIKFVNPECCDLGNMMLDFLIESIQGPCIQNQMELYRNKIIDFSKDFMNDFSSDRDYKSRGFTEDKVTLLDDLISQNIKMLYSLMEANQDKQIYLNMGQNIDFNSLKKKLTAKFLEAFKGVINPNAKKIEPNILDKHIKYSKIFKEDAEEAFNIFFFIQTINDRTGLYKESIKQLENPPSKSHPSDISIDPIEKQAYEFFKEHSAHIEIVFKGKSDIHKVYFMIQPACRYLDKNQKKSFIENVDIDRTTANEKITYFMNHAPKLYDRMDHMSNLRSKCSWVSQKSFKYVRNMCLYTVCAINLFVFVYYEKEVKNSTPKTTSVSFNQLFISITGVMHMFFSFLMLIMWLVLNGKLILMDGWRKEFFKHKKSLNHFLANYTGLNAHSIELSFNKTLVDLTKKEKIKMIKFINEAQGYKHSMPALQYFFQNINFILINQTFKYLSFYICLSIIAFFGDVVILYSIHLLDIINHFDTLGNVIRAITYNKKQLLLTAFLAVILLYFYALFAFTYVDDTFFTTSVEPAGESMCHTLLQCFTTVASLGPRSSGSVGDVLIRSSYQPGTINRLRYYIRWFYDVSIFFIVNIICMKLIFGIIIDTFAELRDKKTVTDYDKDNICFICSLDRYVFDKNADGFDNHISRDHNVWNYLYFMYSLKKKDSTGFNGIESYVEHKMQTDDISWIPMKQALRIKKFEAEKDNLESKVALINEEITKIEKKLNMIVE